MSRPRKIEVMQVNNGWLLLSMDWNPEKDRWEETDAYVYQDEQVLMEAFKELFGAKLKQ